MYADHVGPDDRTTLQRLRAVILGLVGLTVILAITAVTISHLI